MAFKVISVIVLAVTAAANHPAPLFNQQHPLTYVATELENVVPCGYDYSHKIHDKVTRVSETDQRYHDGVILVGGDSINEAVDYSAIQMHGLPVSYDNPLILRGEGSPWNYFIPIANPVQTSVLPLDTTWNYDTPLVHRASTQVLDNRERLMSSFLIHPEFRNADGTSGVKTRVQTANGSSRMEKVPFGYVPLVAKISVPPGYKIH